MPHDSSSASEPVLVSLGVPATAHASLVDGLVRPAPAVPDAPVLDGDAPDEQVSAFLVGAAHTEIGFVARVESGERALAIVAATAAALCGEDIRAALRRPDIAFLRGLKPPAVHALREVLLAVESDTPDEVAHHLGVLAS
ncbi:hypothetical protein BJY24_002568 [Nocardia transvalensis]|uniref:Uncharacterized protein n=1 Tax=Nocardia transvalensis TaxID=37333 RepID=A0A7W9PD44_9NOCA|nr:hypothetical protein [Nocardia transvalensis]MBB5913701.1 hypothetical protein [Nocardia transvalensis]